MSTETDNLIGECAWKLLAGDNVGALAPLRSHIESLERELAEARATERLWRDRLANYIFATAGEQEDEETLSKVLGPRAARMLPSLRTAIDAAMKGESR